jgi:Nif-specific regulatory protein
MIENNSLMDPEQLHALVEVGKAINSIAQKQPLLETVMDKAVEAIQAERGFLLLRDEATREPRIVVARNISEHQAADIVRPSASVINQVFESNIGVWSVKPLEDFGGSQSVMDMKLTAVACVPLVLKGTPIGAIYLDSAINRQQFNDTTLNFLQAFANQAAIAIENANFIEELQLEKNWLQSELERTYAFKEIIGTSPKMQAVFDVMRKILNSDISVLLEGESGTGKELVARAIHYNSHRKDKSFVAQFCGNLSENLLESELFGHKKGSFTGAINDKRGLFEVADGGTFFLDEIADISPVIQAKLLRVLQEGTFRRVGDTEYRHVDVRIISATNKNLKSEVKKSNFREDLFYRLNVISITMPPLRERRSDIPLLVHHFLHKISDKSGQKTKRLTPDAMRALTNYSWPGNVRELENTIERAVVLSGDEPVSLRELIIPESDGEGLKSKSLKEQEREIVLKTLDECEGNKTKTAEVLGVSLRWLHYKLNEWQVVRPVRSAQE